MATITALSAQQTIFDRLISSDVIRISSLTGGVYMMARPDDSLVEDIVIGVLAMNAEQSQEGVFNVNIHVPNLKLSNVTSIADMERLKAICDIVMPMLENYRGFDYGFDVKAPGLPYRDGLDWFLNIQVEFYTLRKQN